MSPRALAAGAVLIPLLVAAGAHADPALSPLPWRVSGRVEFTVDAACFPESTGYVADVYVRVPYATIAKLADDPHGVSQLRVSAELSGSGGRRKQEQLVTLAPDDTTGGFGKVVVLPFRAKPGLQKLKVRVEDALSRKPGLVGIVRAAHEASEVDGEFELQRPIRGRDLSDPEFAWEAHPAGSRNPFTHAGREIVPDPERLYGLLDTDLRVVFTARSPDSTRVWRWRARILDGQHAEVATVDTILTAGPRLAAETAFDVSRLPAGGYDLEIHAWQEGDAVPLARNARFSVAWRPESWRRGSTDMADIAHFLLSADDEEHFVAMQAGEQERWLEDFWRRRDPSPETAVNEARDAFLRRIDIANQRFSRAGLERGMFSDMGRVYIRYGEPSEVLKQVMPAGDETLLQELQQLQVDEDRDLGDIEQKGPGGDIRPYEVWVYEGEIPMPLDVDPHEARVARHKKLLFLFVDEHGLGDFRLRYSNE